MKRIYQWLVERNAFSGIIGSVIFPIIFVPLFVWCTTYIKKHTDQDHEKVCISIPKDLADYSFYLRYVREGPGSWREGPVYNDDFPLEDANEVDQNQQPIKCRTITFTRHYGAQFKPYICLTAECLKGKRSLSLPQIKQLLEGAHFDLSYDPGPDRENFWFFLLPKDRYDQVPDYGAKETFQSPHPIYNNFIVR